MLFVIDIEQSPNQLHKHEKLIYNRYAMHNVMIAARFIIPSRKITATNSILPGS
jgi:hypothetical protein